MGFFEVFISLFGDYSSAWRAVDHTDHQEVWFIDVFEVLDLLADGGGDGLQANRSAMETFDDGC